MTLKEYQGLHWTHLLIWLKTVGITLFEGIVVIQSIGRDACEEAQMIMRPNVTLKEIISAVVWWYLNVSNEFRSPLALFRNSTNTAKDI